MFLIAQHSSLATRSGRRAYDPRKPQVNILTVQSSKGLEFRSVESSETQAAQNMKLIYVGMTRAKEHLLITASAESNFTEKFSSTARTVCAVAQAKKQRRRNCLPR